MKKLGSVILLGAVALLAGCNQSSDSNSAGTPSNSGADNVSSAPAPASRPGGESRQYNANADTNTANSYPADNTGRNKRDRNDAAVTPTDESNKDGDLQITQRLRRAITSNDQLSTTAKNIKIITEGGKVTLRGPVSTAQDQQTINSIVQQLGIQNVDNQLEVKSQNQ